MRQGDIGRERRKKFFREDRGITDAANFDLCVEEIRMLSAKLEMYGRDYEQLLQFIMKHNLFDQLPDHLK